MKALATPQEVVEGGSTHIREAIGLVRATFRAGDIHRRRVHVDAVEGSFRDVPDVPARAAAEVIDVRVLAATFEPAALVG
jgi:hypothetical protein